MMNDDPKYYDAPMPPLPPEQPAGEQPLTCLRCGGSMGECDFKQRGVTMQNGKLIMSNVEVELAFTPRNDDYPESPAKAMVCKRCGYAEIYAVNPFILFTDEALKL